PPVRGLRSSPTRRSSDLIGAVQTDDAPQRVALELGHDASGVGPAREAAKLVVAQLGFLALRVHRFQLPAALVQLHHVLGVARTEDRKSTRLNSSHVKISY